MSDLSETAVITRHTGAKVSRPQLLTFRINGLTISADLSQKVYGTGPDVYMSVRSSVEGATLEQLPDVVDGALDMFVHVWRTLCAGQLATKLTSQSAEDFTALLHKVDKRLVKVKALLLEPEPE
jgi:hypothetical protein